jgi:hypothetical protein
MHNFFFLGANVIGMSTGYALERYTRIDFLQKFTIQTQRDQADKLLFNILPERIAEQLKQSPDTIAEEFDSGSRWLATHIWLQPASPHCDLTMPRSWLTWRWICSIGGQARVSGKKRQSFRYRSHSLLVFSPYRVLQGTQSLDLHNHLIPMS